MATRVLLLAGLFFATAHAASVTGLTFSEQGPGYGVFSWDAFPGAEFYSGEFTACGEPIPLYPPLYQTTYSSVVIPGSSIISMKVVAHDSTGNPISDVNGYQLVAGPTAPLSCPSSCGPNGVCGPRTGDCVCDDGYEGEQCENTAAPCECPVREDCYPYMCAGSYMCGSSSCQVYGCVNENPQLNPPGCSYTREASNRDPPSTHCCGDDKHYGCAECQECPAPPECWNDEAGEHTCPDCSTYSCSECPFEQNCAPCGGVCTELEGYACPDGSSPNFECGTGGSGGTTGSEGTTGSSSGGDDCAEMVDCNSCSSRQGTCGWCASTMSCMNVEETAYCSDGSVAKSVCPPCMDADTCNECGTREGCSWCKETETGVGICTSEEFCPSIGTPASTCAGEKLYCGNYGSCAQCLAQPTCTYGTFESEEGSTPFCWDTSFSPPTGFTFTPDSTCDAVTGSGGATTGGSAGSAGCFLPAITGAVWSGSEDCLARYIESGASCSAVPRNGYTCDAATVTCSNGETLGNTDVTCEAEAPCPPYDLEITNGAHSCATTTTSGSSCAVTCDAGFTKTGNLVCSNGVWSSATCQVSAATDCTVEPVNVENSVPGPSCGATAAGGRCLLTCMDGYIKSSDFMCLEGTWSQPACAEPASIASTTGEEDKVAGASAIAPLAAAAVALAVSLLMA